MKLISMTDFFLKNAPKFNPLGNEEQASIFDLIHKYAKFLKQPLTLGMFVPCDEHGIVLAEPNIDNSEYYTINNNGYLDRVMFKDNLEIYEQAKEKVLFKEFDTKGGLAVAKAICTTYKTIEELTYKKVPLVDLLLTEQGVKQSGLKC